MQSLGLSDQARRLHPVSPFVRVLGYARQLIVAFFLFWVAAQSATWELAAAWVCIPLAIYEFIRYFTTSYALKDDQIVVRQGILFRSERHIPYERIQNVDLVQNLVHRVFGVAEVRIETASGSEPEAILKVLSLEDVDRVRQRIFGTAAQRPEATAMGDGEVAQTTAVEGETLLHLSVWELVKLGVCTYRGLAVVGILVGLAWQLDLESRFPQGWDAADNLFELTGWQLALAIASIICVSFIIVTILSIIWAVVTLYDYRLARRGEDLRITCGLFTRLTATIPRRRVQLVSVQTSPLHRYLNRATIRIETAGGSGDDDQIPVSRRWLVPLAPTDRVPELLAEIAPEIELDPPEWNSLHPLAVRRMTKRAVVVGLLISIPCSIPFGWFGLAVGPVILTLIVWHARALARSMRYAYGASGVVFRSGVVMRRTSATRYDRIQVVGQTQTPFDRRYQMAGVEVDTAGAGPSGHRIRIPYLDQIVAQTMYQHFVDQTQRTEFEWQ